MAILYYSVSISSAKALKLQEQKSEHAIFQNGPLVKITMMSHNKLVLLILCAMHTADLPKQIGNEKLGITIFLM